MKRLHVHVAVDDLDKSIAFYSDMFDAKPNVLKPDYAKWMLDDPRVNFAISSRGAAAGLDHLGIQVDTQDELAAVSARMAQAGHAVRNDGKTTCCYAKSDKSWIADPAGISWESFLTFGDSTTYGETDPAAKSACCEGVAKAPAKATAACC
ncbi:MAG: glyoxalase/bleomycin resistance/dioxygenase family protein [Alphaproteobacteria bacterium]|nr:glyoxalase/bleomycin resistance/dioxygenase family protein [Alphaproteobacteria bacterium]